MNYFYRHLSNSLPKSSTHFWKMDSSERDPSDYEFEYDSTWEDEEYETETSELKTSLHWTQRPCRNIYAAKDMQDFRHRLQATTSEDSSTSDEDESELPNLMFYRNLKPSKPDGMNIEDYHGKWSSDYRNMERNHFYIQWLFPIQEQGMNSCAYPLSQKEIKLFREDAKVKQRLLTSYKLMLNFYGIKLVNEESGEVAHADDSKKRFDNLNRNTHNNLRITRILKCLGILGFQHYQRPLVQFFLQETLVEMSLPNVRNSALDYFMFAVLNKEDRKALIKFAFLRFEPKEEFVWCPKRIQRRFLKQEKEHESPASSESEFNPSIKPQHQIPAPNPSTKSENTTASCPESETQPLREASESISPSEGVSNVQGEDELQSVTELNSSNNMDQRSSVGCGENAPSCFQDLHKKMIKHPENAGHVITSNEELSVQAECVISIPDDAIGDSRHETAVSQKSGSEVTETDVPVQKLEQTTAKESTGEEKNAELGGEDSDVSGESVLSSQPPRENVQEMNGEHSSKSDSGGNGGSEGTDSETHHLPGSETATGAAGTSALNKGTRARSESPLTDANQRTSTEDDMTEVNVANPGGFIVPRGNNAYFDPTSVAPGVSDELEDRRGARHSVDESRGEAESSGVRDDDEASTGDTPTTGNCEAET